MAETKDRGDDLSRVSYYSSKISFSLNSKLPSIALKEANETEYRLMLLKESEYIDEQNYSSIHADCEELIRLLVSIVKTIKINNHGTK